MRVVKEITRLFGYPPIDVIRETIAETREERKRLRRVPASAPAVQSNHWLAQKRTSSIRTPQTAGRLSPGPSPSYVAMGWNRASERGPDRTTFRATPEPLPPCSACRALRRLRVERNSKPTVDEQEQLCQVLWQRYYEAVNIRSRNNPALHRRQLPRRDWGYLTEKNPVRRAP